MVKENFGILLKKIRKENKMTLKALSEKSSVTITQIHNLETNKCKPNTITLAKLSKALDYDFE